ncbi:CGNR zinc finger domain-containing protein [Sporosarcina siberiensis]|uniref:CGNR zinc finger domain-containing protein n=1 Tax=Sporosarcina siberiensis TaxID=1365606 RepID=A0ABW4SJU7_9BACL
MTNNLETRYSYLCEYLFMNLLNTIKRENDIAIDLLSEEGVMDEWIALMEAKGLLQASQVDKIREVSIDVKKVQAFRDLGRRSFSQEGTHPDLMGILSSYTKQSPLAFDAEFMPLPSQGGSDGLLALLSFEMLQAYQGDLFQKVKKCGSPTCYAFFVDTSGRRKWCSMEICGNREKARRHYSKKVNE